MTKKRSKELRAKSVSELQDSLHGARSELAKLLGVKSAGVRPENPGKIKSLRRSISRHLTIMHEKKMVGGR